MTESVAYMSEEGVLFKELPPNPMFELTPLYKRHELSDEEILDTARTMPVINGATMEQAYVLFARAILKKAESK
tara:strand:- start:1656 stop:1877 length:222 start_codon:yes stop_codon:yes gene_type:complete